ncbi:MAG TPA: F0F1 ATP synthase subunit B [Solirubrobacteraceae bacterium]|jgi:F-type H+-transporting ATPase subunit b|nr:F0F1 ATP synthase subunit B [Solirubrobacteraceae bacterium]
MTNTPIADSGSWLITPNVGIMFWTLVVFGVSLFVLNKAVFPRIRDALDARQRTIEESIDTAAQLKTEAHEVLADYKERLKEARVQAEGILERARATAEAAQKRAIDEAKEKREELLEQTRRDVEAETRRAISEIRSEVANMTILATEKVTRKHLTDDDQKRLVEEALSELDFTALAAGSEHN